MDGTNLNNLSTNNYLSVAESMLNDKNRDVYIGYITSDNDSYTIKLFPKEEVGEIANLAQRIILTSSKTNPNEKMGVIAGGTVADNIRSLLSEGKKLTILHPNGSKVTHDIHTISFTALKAEDFSVLERALNQLFSNLEEARKKAAQAKAQGKEVEYLPTHVEVESSKIKDGKKVEAAKKRIVDPDMQKKAAEIVATNIARNMTKEQIKDQQAQEKEDKIKQTEEQRSERRQEIKQESIANQAQKLEIDREDEKISKKRKI